ncbi:hypothetical protein BCD67_06260 [Oscillatoriales cyanobacterium USR001]|nr:hypothetical protein BCD67_06260 [Oscillatoriales cyanobacterium USR001]
MPLKIPFQIVESPTKIEQQITKFGGQPVWISQPYWPLCPETGKQMMFLGQISLNQELFPNSNGIMVYLFFSGESEPIYKEAIAAVIQSTENVYKSADSQIEFVSEAIGPVIYELDENRQILYKEYQVILNPIGNEDWIPLNERYTANDFDIDTGFQFSQPELAGNKIGGQPLYIEGLSNPPEPFNSEEWLLLLQLAPTAGYWGTKWKPNFYPFYMELGEFAILTVFISPDYKQVEWFIQQP